MYSTGIRNPEELSVMKFMDKDDLKKNIKEHLNTKKKRDSLHDQMPASNGVNHSNSGSLDRLSPYPNRSPAGPSPNVSTLLDFIGWCLQRLRMLSSVDPWIPEWQMILMSIYITIKCIPVVASWHTENGVKLVILRNVYLWLQFC